ncbi:M15 family metallopeptidase [Actinotalea sp. M2MS4P-6]|uniref:M15 family metallopeptidase n=1 Tax=Actinotalea sp. M2MS4P-6 TaxID=2983762 RepID=UPI0021E43B61|nr:M15 family metallopeptidase [Actinotalea sp. M2MS4P-6]MCV2395854.1 M15 family metallopeptidase [Actinotalea sp. M2MS4P-6]
MGTHAQRRVRPWWPLAVVLLVLAAVATVVAVQVRASAAEQRREAAAQAQAEADASAAAQAEADRIAAAQEAEQARQAAVADGALALSWATANKVAQTDLADADELLGQTDGQVDDDSTRDAVTAAVETLTAALGVTEPDQQHVAAASAATAALRQAIADLDAAHQSWLDARAAEQAAAAAAAARSSYSGDCGGAGSYETSTPSATTLYTSVPTDDGDGSNGNLPRSAMTALGWCVDSAGHAQWLRSDAAAAMVRLNAAFRAQFGENIAIDLSYRSYADQVRARELYGGLAAQPGTSNHGWGTAIDTWEWAAYDFGTPRYEWLVQHGPDYGWYCPAATESGNPEYWHFEYRG